LLSSLTTNQVRESIAAENDLTFSRVKGIGPKTAKRIILDLKDKISKDFTQNGNIPIHQGNMMKEEALFALLALGFQRQAAGTALQKVLKENDNIASLEALIKAALSQLSS
jgi:Holliday junction DNA helicase RuvA